VPLATVAAGVDETADPPLELPVGLLEPVLEAPPACVVPAVVAGLLEAAADEAAADEAAADEAAAAAVELAPLAHTAEVGTVTPSGPQML